MGLYGHKGPGSGVMGRRVLRRFTIGGEFSSIKRVGEGGSTMAKGGRGAYIIF